MHVGSDLVTELFHDKVRQSVLLTEVKADLLRVVLVADLYLLSLAADFDIDK